MIKAIEHNQLADNRIYTQVYEQPDRPPHPEALVGLRFHEYSLLGIRDHKTELAITIENQRLKTNFKTPLLYTLVSQNRKIPINKPLSTSHRVFLNLESFRWSEFYFHFFKEFTHSNTNDWVFKNLMYSLDSLIGHYHFICRSLSNLSTDVYLENPIERTRHQSLLMAWILGHEQAESLFFIYFYELILISIQQSQRALCSSFISPTEAQLILKHFTIRNVLAVDSGKIRFVPEKLFTTLKEYVSNKGKLLFTNSHSNPITESHFTDIRKLFFQKEDSIDSRFFETSFYHR